MDVDVNRNGVVRVIWIDVAVDRRLISRRVRKRGVVNGSGSDIWVRVCDCGSGIYEQRVWRVSVCECGLDDSYVVCGRSDVVDNRRWLRIVKRSDVFVNG